MGKHIIIKASIGGIHHDIAKTVYGSNLRFYRQARDQSDHRYAPMRQVVLQRGLPFEMKLPEGSPVDICELSGADLDREIEKGIADINAGRMKPAEQVFSNIRKDYDL